MEFGVFSHWSRGQQTEQRQKARQNGGKDNIFTVGIPYR